MTTVTYDTYEFLFFDENVERLCLNAYSELSRQSKMIYVDN